MTWIELAQKQDALDARYDALIAEASALEQSAGRLSQKLAFLVVASQILLAAGLLASGIVLFAHYAHV